MRRINHSEFMAVFDVPPLPLDLLLQLTAVRREISGVMPGFLVLWSRRRG